ncbi:tRNA (N6-threonylcarbamoyladenosine(37)-N6)-methyltransferase TrmO [Neisseriaceae bacterium TC5R-5]|nr:tRNA (N6-threonylcarbamoyladenosine(37)-N6)-methyltransferase TrmO [Neisseriaceae bacterium TC5R-5]
MRYSFDTIGIIHSPYREKFGIPRQPSLVSAARCTLELLPPYNHPDSVRGLAEFSHVWISFVFHQTMQRGWQALVRPPRLGGNSKIGVFASRSSHRPNPLGLSLVKLLAVETQPSLRLILQGADLLHGTPVLDIKPYIPFIEAQTEACGGFANTPPPQLHVNWSDVALACANDLSLPPDLILLIEQVLAQNPRPAYQHNPERRYGIMLECYNIIFRLTDNIATVLEITAITQN